MGWNMVIATWPASTGRSAPVTATPYSVSTPKIRQNPSISADGTGSVACRERVPLSRSWGITRRLFARSC